MIYLTQLIFVHKGKEATFLEFERLAIPLMAKHNGRLLYRIRPGEEGFVDAWGEVPYEVHFISFDFESDMAAFMQDKARLDFIHLKAESVKSVFLVKGEKV